MSSLFVVSSLFLVISVSCCSLFSLHALLSFLSPCSWPRVCLLSLSNQSNTSVVLSLYLALPVPIIFCVSSFCLPSQSYIHVCLSPVPVSHFASNKVVILSLTFVCWVLNSGSISSQPHAYFTWDKQMSRMYTSLNTLQLIRASSTVYLIIIFTHLL